MSEHNIRRLTSAGLVVVLCIIFGLAADSFFTPRNFVYLLRDAAYLGLLGLGASFVIIGGGVDLSGGGIICFVGVVVARCSMIPGIPGVLVLLVGALAGALCGLLNAVIVNRLRLSEFVTTLATGSVFSGLALLTTFREGGRIVTVTLKNASFLEFGKTLWGGLCWISIAWIVLLIVMQFILTSTKMGLHIVAMGSNHVSAARSGIDCKRYKIYTFVIGGAFAGLAAAFVTANQMGTNLSLGSGMAFQAVAACVVGGVNLEGGKGDPIASFFGALILVLITNGLYKLGLSTGGTYVLQGVVIVLALCFDAMLKRLSQRRLSLQL